MAFTETDLQTIHTHGVGTSTVANLNNLQTEQITSLAADQAGDMVLGTAVLTNGTKVVLSATMRQSATSYQSYFPAQVASAQLTTIDTSNNVSTQNLSFSGGSDLSVSAFHDDRVEIVPLTGGGFVVAETTVTDNLSVKTGNNNPNLYYEVFDNTGAVTKSWTQVNSTDSHNNDFFQLRATSSGGFDIAWMENNEVQDFYRRFDASGNPTATANHFVTGADNSTIFSWTGGFATDTAGHVVVTTGSGNVYTPQTVKFYNSTDNLISSQTFAQAEAGLLPTVTNPSPHQGTNPVNVDNALPQFVPLPSGGFLATIALPTGPFNGGYPGFNMYVQKVSISGSTVTWGTPALVETISGNGPDALNPQVLSDGKVLLTLHPNINSGTSPAAALAFRDQTNYEIIDPSNLPNNNSTVVSSTQPFSGLTLSPTGAEMALQHNPDLLALNGPSLLSADNSGGIFAALQTGIFTTFYSTLDASLYAADFTSAPPPTISSSNYDVSTGNLTVTGSNFTTAAADFSATALTLTGEGGNTYTLTGGSIEANPTATRFVVDLSAADQLALDGLLNNNGTSSVGTTTYNLAATSSFDTGGAADTTSAVTVSNARTPTISSVAFDYATGVLTLTGSGFENEGSTGGLRLGHITFTGHAGATYTLASAFATVSSQTSATITLPPGANLSNLKALFDKNGTVSSGGTTYNFAATSGWDSNAGSSISTEGVTVSGITPTISSSSYDASTGHLTVAGIGFTASAGDYSVAALTLTGEDGTTYTLTGGSTIEANPSATTFIVDLSAADQLALDGLLNKNGTSSVGATIYNLAATSSFDTGGNAATSTVTVGNALTPTISSVAFNYATGVLTLTGTGFENEGATGGLRLGDFTLTGQGGATHTLTSANAAVTSQTSATITLTGADLSSVKALFDANGTSSLGGTTYNLAATAHWDSGAGASITTEGVTVTNVPPTISSSSYDASTGHLTVGGTGFTTSAADFSATALTLTGQDGTTYTLTGGSTIESNPTSTSFVVDLSAADQLALDGLLNKNGTSSVGATTYNLAATSSFDTGGVADTTSAVTVSNALAPTISSVAFNYATGALTLTGTGFENEGATGGLRLGDFTFTGQSGGTYTLASANAAVTSQTSAAITLAGTDLTNVRALFDQNGTVSPSGTTYNLAATAHWDSGAGSAISTEGVTVSGIAPTISSSSYDASTGHLTIGGIGFTASAADYSATALTLTGQDGTTYTLTGGSTIENNPSSTSFVVDLSATDQLALDGLLNKNGTSSVGATTYNLAASSSFDTGGNANSTVAVAVSNALTPTIGSVAFDFAAGVLTLTGTGFENEGATGGLRLGDFTLTGQGGATYTLASANAAVTSQTSAAITLTGTDLTNVRALLDKNGTTSADNTTYNLAATLGWDAGAGASISTEGITVSGSGPQITAGATVNFNGGGGAVALDPALALSDGASSTLVGATVSIGSANFLMGDTLNFVNGNGITGSYNAATGVLSLSGSASIAAYQAALQSVTYSFNPPNGDPTGGGADLSRTIDWVGNDGTFSNKAVTSTLFTAHVAPTVTAGATASFTGGGSPVALDSGFAISAPDSGGQLTSASVTINLGFTAGDTLSFTNQNGITGSYNSATGVLSLSGRASVAAYQAELQSVTYGFNPANGDPTHGGGDTSRSLDWVVGDGASFSNDAFSTLNVAHVAPSATPDGTIKYRSGDPAVTLNAGFTVADPDSGGNLTGATVQITGGTFAGDGDLLAAATTGTNIHASYNGATETLTLSGTDTLANYQSVLNGTTFVSGADPTHGGADTSRTLTWTLNDGSSSNGTSTPVTSQILLGTFGTALEQAADGTVDFITFQGNTLIQSDSLFSSWNIRAEGDFDHDGKTELVSQSPTTGQIDLLFVNSSGGLQGSELLQGDYGKVVGAGNFDGSGRTGIATQNTQTGQVDLLWFTGTQLTGSELLSQALPRIVGAADFNGDGQTDLLGQTSTGQLDFLFFNGANLTGSSLTSQSYAPVHDVSNFGAPGNSQIVTQNPTTSQMDFLDFSGTSLVNSQFVDQSNMTPLPLVQGSTLAGQLFHVG